MMSEPYKVGTKLWAMSKDGQPVECEIKGVQYHIDTSGLGIDIDGIFVNGDSWIGGKYADFYETPYELRKARRAKIEQRLAECQAELAALTVSTDEA